MTKKTLGPQTMLYPMPALLIGADVDGKPNFMAASWSGIACTEPPMLTVAFQPQRHTLKGVKKNRTFSVNIPSVAQMKETDYTGIFSGSKEPDKTAIAGFEVFYGATNGAPMIAQCPVNLECTVVITLELGSHDLIVGQIREVHASEDVLDADGKVDPAKVDPLIFTVPDRSYRRMGEVVGKAFKVGAELKKG
ncbi:MAG: flavin reductase family protein [Nitrospirae bacterium]|nr:flavin reductase family protein [Nitrospirota bacterium]